MRFYYYPPREITNFDDELLVYLIDCYGPSVLQQITESYLNKIHHGVQVEAKKDIEELKDQIDDLTAAKNAAEKLIKNLRKIYTRYETDHDGILRESEAKVSLIKENLVKCIERDNGSITSARKMIASADGRATHIKGRRGAVELNGFIYDLFLKLKSIKNSYVPVREIPRDIVKIIYALKKASLGYAPDPKDPQRAFHNKQAPKQIFRHFEIPSRISVSAVAEKIRRERVRASGRIKKK